MKLAVDAMGGDKAPLEVVKGAVMALKEIQADLVLLGDESRIRAELDKYQYDESRISIHHTTEVVENEDKPVNAIKRKRDSSMVVGLDMVKKGEVSGIISAGNTGALLAGGLLRVGRIRGIDRPGLASVYPMDTGMGILVDAGANAEVKPENLRDFGMMGALYAKRVLGIEDPKVGLVNVGAEKGKGTPVVQEAYDLLDQEGFTFIGNLEARDIPAGYADVIVTDGFTGNVILKLSEGIAKSFGNTLKEGFTKNPLSMMAGLIMKKHLAGFKKKMDYTEYGGAPLLGVKGAVVKAHGSSNGKAIKNAIRYGERYVATGVISEVVNLVEKRR